MNQERPDLSQVSPEVLAYVEALETEVAQLRMAEDQPSHRGEDLAEPSEAPTTINVITVSGKGVAKRTPRHLYLRQRRGGMGVFDLDSGEDDPPAFLVMADQSDSLTLLTNQGRAFPLPVQELPESPVHSRGQPLSQRLQLRPNERLATIFPVHGGSHLVLVTERGQVRRFSGHLVGSQLRPGTALYDVREGGAPAATCWVKGVGDLLITTRQGKAIRFGERLVPVRGCLGIRLDVGDHVVGVAAVSEESGVVLLGSDGKGTIRLMAGFSANKSPGAGGKTILRTEQLVGAAPALDGDDIFVISALGKIIRFQAVEVPAKEGVVQGVNCMSLRSDECRALAVASISAHSTP